MIEQVRLIQTLPNYTVDIGTPQGVAVYSQTLPIPTKDSVLGGWKYEKDAANPTGKFIYYFKQHETLSTILIRDLKRFYMVCTMTTMSTHAEVPFLVTYTVPLGDGQDAQPWYRTRVSYSIKTDVPIYNGMKLLLWAGSAHEEPPDFPNLKKIRLTNRIVDGPDKHDETLNFISAHCDSATPTGYTTTTHNLSWCTYDNYDVLWELD